MRSSRTWLAVGLVGGLVLASIPPMIHAQKLDSESVKRRQQVQQRVQTMARQLVNAVLDIQLQQLRENGMDSHEWFGDIQTMREHMDELWRAMGVFSRQASILVSGRWFPLDCAYDNPDGKPGGIERLIAFLKERAAPE